MEDFRVIGRRVSNWGRWGADDQRGTANLITPAHVAEAATLVRSGETFGLAVPFEEAGPQDGAIRPNPRRYMARTGQEPTSFPGSFRYADDYVFMALQAASQWDALAHVNYDGLLYNGFPADSVTAQGAAFCSIERLCPGVVGRGVLLDAARHRGADWLPAGSAIGPEELDEIVAAQEVDIRAGDVVLIRTGWRRMFTTTRDSKAFKAGEPGLSVRCADWLHARDVSALGSDNFAIEVLPGEYPDEFLPLHMIALRDMGLPLAEILDLEELAAACAEDRRYEFLFVGAALPFAGGVGSPANPIVLR